MARTSVLTGGSNNDPTTSEDLNGPITDLYAPGVVGPNTNTAGVSPATGGLAVNAQGSPNMTVAITAGTGYVRVTPAGQGSQVVRVKMDANSAYTINANATGGTRFDWIYINTDATLANNPDVAASTVSTFVTSRSTSNTTDNGTPPTYGLVIAIVTVANGAVTIVNGNITDKRVLVQPSTGQALPSSQLSNAYKFSVYMAAATQAVANNTDTTVAFDTKFFDTGSNVDLVTNKGLFTAPVAGFYHFDLTVNGGTGTPNSAWILGVQKNGVAFRRLSQITGLAWTPGSGTIQLAAGDTIRPYAFQNTGGSINIGGGGAPYLTTFDGFLVSAL